MLKSLPENVSGPGPVSVPGPVPGPVPVPVPVISGPDDWSRPRSRSFLVPMIGSNPGPGPLIILVTALVLVPVPLHFWSRHTVVATMDYDMVLNRMVVFDCRLLWLIGTWLYIIKKENETNN